MNKNKVERTDEICADDPTGNGDGDVIEGHGPICGRNLFRETNQVASREVNCSSCNHYLTVTRSFGPDKCPECDAELSYSDDAFVEEKMFCQIHGSNIPIKSKVEKNVKEREDGNSPLQYVNRD